MNTRVRETMGALQIGHCWRRGAHCWQVRCPQFNAVSRLRDERGVSYSQCASY